MKRVNVTIQRDLFPIPHAKEVVEGWLTDGLVQYDNLSITWKADPWGQQTGELQHLIRLEVQFTIDGDFKYAGDAASQGQDAVQEILAAHWGLPIEEFERTAWGTDARVSKDFSFLDLYQELGVLVVASGNLERAVRELLLLLLPGEDWTRTELVVDGLSASQMAERCERVAYATLQGALLSDVVAWLGRVRKAQVERNEFIHSSWAGKALVADGEIGPARMSSRVRKAKDGITRKVSAPTPAEIRQVAGRCSELDLQGTHLYIEIQNFATSRDHEGESAPLPWQR